MPKLVPYGEKELSRQTSPDGVLDAVVIEGNPGAFSSFQFFHFLVKHGSSTTDPRTDPYIVATSEGDELQVVWKSSHFLSVDPGNSHVKQFANYWYSANFPNYGVELDYDQRPNRHYLAPDGSFTTRANYVQPF